MTFRYQEINPQIIRPIIPVIIKSEKVVIFYFALIDSGADHCIFDLSIAKKLDLKLDFKNKVKFIGINKKQIVGFWGEVDLRIGDKTYTTKVIFSKLSDFDHVILGQLGFFDHFDVKLSYQEQIIEIEPVKLTN